jgi:hypothetical protein
VVAEAFTLLVPLVWRWRILRAEGAVAAMGSSRGGRW